MSSLAKLIEPKEATLAPVVVAVAFSGIFALEASSLPAMENSKLWSVVGSEPLTYFATLSVAEPVGSVAFSSKTL